MKKLACVLALAALAAAEPVHATCANGFSIYLSGQLPDIKFKAGVPAAIRFDPYYASFNSTSYSCGIFARSTTPGVSLQGTYGCPGEGCPVAPPGTWAPVGDAYSTPVTTISHKDTDIPILYDGSAPAGTQGTIEIAIRDNDAGIDSQVVIGRMNVYIEPATGTPPRTSFMATSSATNVSSDRLYLDHPYLNGNPGQNLFVSHVRNPGGMLFGTSWDHPIAVDYDPFLARWAIRNVDAVAMPTGLSFYVRVDPSADLYCTPAFPGIYPHITILDAQANSNIFATLMVTPIGGPPNPIAVRYVSPNWRIVYSNGANIPAGTCFNVKAFAFTQYIGDPASGDLSSRSNVAVNWGTGVDTSGFGTGHNSGATRVLQFDWALGNPFREMILTYNSTPLGFTVAFDPRNFGFTAPDPFTPFSRWGIYHEDGTTMGNLPRFNAWGPCAADAWYPDGDGDGHGGAGTVRASCAPLAGYAGRGGDCNDGNPTEYPGSPEINDGQDNQCGGNPGDGLVDEISGLTQFSDDVTVCWPAQSGATSYQLARSGARTFVSCSYVTTTNTACATDAANPSPGQVFYYLVRAQAPWVGSWGARSSGQERLLSCQ